MSSALTGYLWAVVSVLGFGSNFAVVAKYEAGDGMFFQLVLCLGVWTTGMAVFLLRHVPKFYPEAMIGGVLWCTGNCMTVFIIKSIGLGSGLITWGTAALVIGWLTGFFGLFGVKCDQKCLELPSLNVVGFGLSVLALAVSTLVKKEEKPSSQPAEPLCDEGSNGPGETGGVPQMSSAGGASTSNRMDSGSPSRVKGILAAIFAGTCYGLNFLPSTLIQDHVIGASKNGLDYVFNQFCGILAASIVYFLVYCAATGNKPFVNPQIILPGFLSGVMWATAQAGWFVANVDIGYSAAFPIIIIGPGVVGSMWSVFLFKEIRGRRNFYLLASYFLLAVASCACIIASRKTTPECER